MHFRGLLIVFNEYYSLPCAHHLPRSSRHPRHSRVTIGSRRTSNTLCSTGNYSTYKMNKCMLSIGYTTPKRKIWSAYSPSRCGISDLYHSTIKGPPPSNNSIYDADCKKEQDNARFCSRQRDSWATCRLLQMLKSFLGPSVDHSTSLTGVASSSWIECI